MSERDGWCHVWLHDGRTGRVRSQLARMDLVLRGVQSMDCVVVVNRLPKRWISGG